MRVRRIKDLKFIDSKFKNLINKISAQRALVKIKYNECFEVEVKRISTEQENF